MRIYTQQPTPTKDPDVPKITVAVATNVCAAEAYTITVPSKENRFNPALTWDLSDDECDLLIEALAAARFDRLQQQMAAYEMLHAKFAPVPSRDDEAEIALDVEDES